jgi:hypothetical protein
MADKCTVCEQDILGGYAVYFNGHHYHARCYYQKPDERQEEGNDYFTARGGFYR